MVIKRATRGLGLKNPIIGWKKTYAVEPGYGSVPVLVMLQITGKYLVGARDAGWPTSKRRTSEALVLAQFRIRYDDRGKRCVAEMHDDESKSEHNCNFKYRTGEIVRPTREFAMSHEACAPGIHYFADIERALAY